MTSPTKHRHLNTDMLAYEIHGSHGPPVLMLHGLGSRGEDWIFQIEALQGTYTVITPDLRGHGDSPSMSGWPQMSDLAADVVSLVQRLGVQSVHVVGLSLGGGVALQLAVDHPKLIESVTIVNAAATLRVPRGRLHSAAVRLLLLASGQRRRLGEWVAAGLFPRTDQLELRQVAAERIADNLRLNYFRAIITIVRFDLRSRLQSIQAPTLVVAGELDTTVPMPPKEALARAIPGARLKVIRGSGHATPLDAPDEFNQILLEFLEETVKSSAHERAAS